MSQSPDSNAKIVLFTCTVSVLCALALALAAVSLRPYQEENVRVDKMRNILKAFGVLTDEMKKDKKATGDFFAKNVEGLVVDIDGKVVESAKSASELDYQAELKSAAADADYQAKLPVFVLKEDGKPVAYTIPVVGKGLWSTLLGYMSFESDLNRVRGITFYSHLETPGLGAEIDAPWFQKNFADGKRILDPQGRLTPVIVVKGHAKDLAHDAEDLSHMVDGISGATITSRGVTAMIAKDLGNYSAYFAKLRQEGH